MPKRLLDSIRIALSLEKQRDYRNIVIVQVVIIVFGLTLTEFLSEGSRTATAKPIITIFSIFGVAYAFLLWDLLKNFTKSKFLIRLYFLILLGITVMGALVEFPYYTILEVPNRQLYLLVIHGLLFPVEITVITFAIRDLFSGEFLSPDKLWGAACVFLMTGISFGSLYDLICIVRPGS